jgi:hypothetical protein
MSDMTGVTSEAGTRSQHPSSFLVISEVCVAQSWLEPTICRTRGKHPNLRSQMRLYMYFKGIWTEINIQKYIVQYTATYYI